MISLKTLIRAERAVGVVSNGHMPVMDQFDETVPEDLIQAWKEKIEADAKLHEVMKLHGFFN